VLFGLGIDIVNADFPAVSDNFIFNAPFWHSELNASPFTTKDPNEHSCIPTGATWSSDGYVFDGNDYITIPAGAGLTPEEGTIILWVQFDRDDTNERLFSSNANELSIYHGLANDIRLYYDGAEEQHWTIEATTGDWVHLAFTFKRGGVGRGYEDAVEKHFSTLSNTAPTEATPRIGSHSGAASEFFDGTIGEFRIYGKQLSLTEIQADYNATRWKYEASSEYFHYNLLPAGGVPDNSENWTFCQNNVLPYLEYQEITIGGIQQQYIEWEYDTTFTDQSGNNHDATPTFRTTSSDADVSAVLSSFLPIAEARAPVYALGEAPAFIETTPTIVSEWDVVPPAGTFPLAGVIVAIANATDNPPQLPLLIIACVVIFGISLWFSATIRLYGSGSLIAKIIVITALMGVFIAIGNFGIDFWMLFVFLVIAIALAFGSKQMGWQ